MVRRARVCRGAARQAGTAAPWVRPLPEQPRERPVVEPDATVPEIAALVTRSLTPPVVGGGGALLGAVTVDALLDRLVD